jgi:hypothetical protein
MKQANQIMAQISHLSETLRITEAEHNRLDQISMLSGEGNIKREKINKLKGMQIALIWVIEETKQEELSDELE